jgi:hypothetical protein
MMKTMNDKDNKDDGEDDEDENGDDCDGFADDDNELVVCGLG